MLAMASLTVIAAYSQDIVVCQCQPTTYLSNWCIK